MARGKSYRIAIGQDIYDQLTPEQKDDFMDVSDRYGETYEDPEQGEIYMGDFTGDDFFSEGHIDLTHFAGGTEGDYGEWDKFADMKVYIITMSDSDFRKNVFPVSPFRELGDIDGVKKYLFDLAEKAGKLEQVFFNGRMIKK